MAPRARSAVRRGCRSADGCGDPPGRFMAMRCRGEETRGYEDPRPNCGGRASVHLPCGPSWRDCVRERGSSFSSSEPAWGVGAALVGNEIRRPTRPVCHRAGGRGGGRAWRADQSPGPPAPWRPLALRTGAHDDRVVEVTESSLLDFDVARPAIERSERARRPRGHRRFRDRLLGAELPRPAADQHRQDRPLVRGRPRSMPARSRRSRRRSSRSPGVSA